MQDLEQPYQMLDSFASVGATRFSVTLLDIFERKSGFFPKRTIPSMRYNMRAWMDRAGKRNTWTGTDGQEIVAGENLIIRPVSDTTSFVQLDDLTSEQLDRIRPAAFLIHATSPGNHQAWLAVSEWPGEGAALSRRVRKALGAGDKSATGSTRIAGSENFKMKYAPNFPTVTIVHAVPDRVMTPERLQEMGLLAAPEPKRAFATDIHAGHNAPRRVSAKSGRQWPSYAMSLAGAPMNEEGTGPSRSHADFWWCKLAAQRRFTVEEIAAELVNVSEKARERMRNDPGYVTTTARNGWAAHERDKMRSRGVG